MIKESSVGRQRTENLQYSNLIKTTATITGTRLKTDQSPTKRSRKFTILLVYLVSNILMNHT